MQHVVELDARRRESLTYPLSVPPAAFAGMLAVAELQQAAGGGVRASVRAYTTATVAEAGGSSLRLDFAPDDAVRELARNLHQAETGDSRRSGLGSLECVPAEAGAYAIAVSNGHGWLPGIASLPLLEDKPGCEMIVFGHPGRKLRTGQQLDQMLVFTLEESSLRAIYPLGAGVDVQFLGLVLPFSEGPHGDAPWLRDRMAVLAKKVARLYGTDSTSISESDLALLVLKQVQSTGAKITNISTAAKL